MTRAVGFKETAETRFRGACAAGAVNGTVLNITGFSHGAVFGIFSTAEFDRSHNGK